MKKQKLNYRFYRYKGEALHATSEIPFEITLNAQLMLDQLCYEYNKAQIENRINEALDRGDKETFIQLSETYRNYTWE